MITTIKTNNASSLERGIQNLNLLESVNFNGSNQGISTWKQEGKIVAIMRHF